MSTRPSSKFIGATIGALVVLITIWLGAGSAALVILGAAVGYTIGRVFDGDVDLERLQHGDLSQLKG